jgi:hypothetical protein
MRGRFAKWQPQYATHRIATFPVRVSDGVKKPAIRGWQRVGLPGSAALAQKFADAAAFGFCPGPRSELTILDVDTSDERVLADALDRHGSTPIIVRTGSGNRQAWYRHNGEGRLIRPEPDKPIDILGSGFVVAPPSHAPAGNYQFILGGLNDLDRLPVMRDLPIKATQTSLPDIETRSQSVSCGRRNDTLFRKCLGDARFCDDFDALLDVARTYNAESLEPLSDEEVIKVATSAWGYEERGENRYGKTGVWFSTEEVNFLIKTDPEKYLLKSFLRANNGPKSTFMITNSLASRLGMSRKRLSATRRGLEQSDVERVRPATKRTGPALYRWKAKGGPI